MSSGSFIFCKVGGGGSFEIIYPTVHYCKVMSLLFIYLFIYIYLSAFINEAHFTRQKYKTSISSFFLQKSSSSSFIILIIIISLIDSQWVLYFSVEILLQRIPFCRRALSLSLSLLDNKLGFHPSLEKNQSSKPVMPFFHPHHKNWHK